MIIETKTEQRRKVVQITVAAAALSGSDLLYVLADDGTMWYIAPQLINTNWMRIKDIPDEK